MFLVACLGNPGKEYELTRHNAGFIAADELVRRYNFAPYKSKFDGQIAEGNIGGEKIIILKPETYMNKSGLSLHKALSFYKIPLNNVIVIHDDMDLPAGKLKVKVGGGHGGHNGLKSIDAHLGKEYQRVRLGIGHPQDRNEVVNYVLGRFSKSEKEELDKAIDDVIDNFASLLKGGTSQFLNDVAKKAQKQKNTDDKPTKDDKKELEIKQPAKEVNAIAEAFKMAFAKK